MQPLVHRLMGLSFGLSLLVPQLEGTKHALPYCVFIKQCISMGSHPHYPRNEFQNAAPLWCIFQGNRQSWTALLKSYARRCQIGCTHAWLIPRYSILCLLLHKIHSWIYIPLLRSLFDSPSFLYISTQNKTYACVPSLSLQSITKNNFLILNLI